MQVDIRDNLGNTKNVDENYGRDLLQNLSNFAPNVGFSKVMNTEATSWVETKLGLSA